MVLHGLLLFFRRLRDDSIFLQGQITWPNLGADEEDSASFDAADGDAFDAEKHHTAENGHVLASSNWPLFLLFLLLFVGDEHTTFFFVLALL